MALVVVAELDRDAVRYGVVGVVGDPVAVVDPHVAPRAAVGRLHPVGGASVGEAVAELPDRLVGGDLGVGFRLTCDRRSEEHTSELQSLMRITYAVFGL